MLTFILLVVLAGGVGVVAVSVAERSDPATARGRGHGAARAERSTPPTARRERGRRRGPVPPSLTAVEGSYAAVAAASPLRRVVSAVLIVVIAVAVAASIAAAFGLVAVAVGHALDSAIG